MCLYISSPTAPGQFAEEGVLLGRGSRRTALGEMVDEARSFWRSSPAHVRRPR